MVLQSWCLRLKGLLWIHFVAVHLTPLSTGQPVCIEYESSLLLSGCMLQNMKASPCHDHNIQQYRTGQFTWCGRQVSKVVMVPNGLCSDT